jgi:hypothetical protein
METVPDRITGELAYHSIIPSRRLIAHQLKYVFRGGAPGRAAPSL